ncbi:DUF1990 family protein [Streptomyces sp. NBC_01803]|uniref:DUF1990 family protein n=1 Tax=Streptomyces sp. NBC_01803 TaxID=2975946 RepID=UPI002DD96555|nr:DUF1990 domain-containing protein [Streptomyces sp. NBC_01803]WSA45963.1 DUF1990 domain-containing protein [Streptomyces sp. NBC_01803]
MSTEGQAAGHAGRTDGFTYADVGATRDGGAGAALPPPGFHLLRRRTRVGTGPAARDAAGRALLEWRMHRAVGMSVEADAAEAVAGAEITVGLGAGPLRLRAPCRVVWVVREPERIGFAYGTLSGHPEAGEEAFVVERLPDDSVWLTVTAFSRGVAWYARAAGPLGRAAQRLIARGYGRALRRVTSG